jgi:hypothetical protein
LPTVDHEAAVDLVELLFLVALLLVVVLVLATFRWGPGLMEVAAEHDTFFKGVLDGTLVVGARLWGTDIPRVHWKDKRPHERPESPIIRKVIPSWVWGRMTSEADRHKAGSVRARTAQQRRASDHNRDPTFPRWSPVQWNQARMSRQNYRKIDSISSLFLMCALLSYPHVLPHGRIYKT